MGASVDFEATSSQYMDYNNASSGPHIDITDYPFSFCAWIKHETDSGVQKILNFSDDTATNVYYSLDIFSQNARSVVRNGGGQFSATGTTTINSGTWYFLTSVFTSSTLRTIYVDATSEGTETSSCTYNTGMNHTSMSINIRTTSANYFDGLIAHAQIYDKGLSVSEMQEIMYNPASIPGNLVAWYPGFDSNALGKEISGNGYDMTPTNTPTISADGPPIHLF